MAAVGYLAAAAIAAFMAKDERLGFPGMFLLALVLTPIPLLLGVICFRPAEP